MTWIRWLLSFFWARRRHRDGTHLDLGSAPATFYAKEVRIKIGQTGTSRRGPTDPGAR